MSKPSTIGDLDRRDEPPAHSEDQEAVAELFRLQSDLEEGRWRTWSQDEADAMAAWVPFIVLPGHRGPRPKSAAALSAVQLIGGLMEIGKNAYCARYNCQKVDPGTALRICERAIALVQQQDTPAADRYSAEQFVGEGATLRPRPDPEMVERVRERFPRAAEQLAPAWETRTRPATT